MYDLLLSKKIEGQVLELKVWGIRSENSAIVWGTPMDYMLAKHFVDKLNEYDLPEEELFAATHAFLAEVLTRRGSPSLT